jgi:dihydrofolate synthase/folylpolyglutamate synthase
LKRAPARTFESLDEWLPWLETLSPREIVLGLERVHDVIGRLAPERPGLVINVAGTNGKGSSVAMLEALLRAAGLRTGSYTSPHLCRYNERIRIDGKAADDATVLAALETVDAVRDSVPLTFFEFGTLAALQAFSEARVDAWLLEVGMGGRLDAVNAVEPDGCLITNIGLDHCAWLGDDVESIAREKAGIMRPSTPVVFGARDVPKAIYEQAETVGADLWIAGRDFDHEIHADGRWTWRGERHTFRELLPPAVPGTVQVQNAAAVLAVLEMLGRDDALAADRISVALDSMTLPGRFQTIDDRWILDVAHNPAAAGVLAGQLAVLGNEGRLTAIVGMLGDKDVEAFAGALEPVVDRWIAVSVGGSRKAAPEALAGRIANVTGKPCLIADGVDAALDQADRGTAGGDRILVTGSYYLVGPALELLAAD